ncbi:hypothetical protein HJFPF1_00719 [Paramyrothecium foliicola]|nr:hypothetical protein HJFPF1_00719 [Paramyrothecium foliicola]
MATEIPMTTGNGYLPTETQPLKLSPSPDKYCLEGHTIQYRVSQALTACKGLDPPFPTQHASSVRSNLIGPTIEPCADPQDLLLIKESVATLRSHFTTKPTGQHTHCLQGPRRILLAVVEAYLARKVHLLLMRSTSLTSIVEMYRRPDEEFRVPPPGLRSPGSFYYDYSEAFEKVPGQAVTTVDTLCPVPRRAEGINQSLVLRDDCQLHAHESTSSVCSDIPQSTKRDQEADVLKSLGKSGCDDHVSKSLFGVNASGHIRTELDHGIISPEGTYESTSLHLADGREFLDSAQSLEVQVEDPTDGSSTLFDPLLELYESKPLSVCKPSMLSKDVGLQDKTTGPPIHKSISLVDLASSRILPNQGRLESTGLKEKIQRTTETEHGNKTCDHYAMSIESRSHPTRSGPAEFSALSLNQEYERKHRRNNAVMRISKLQAIADDNQKEIEARVDGMDLSFPELHSSIRHLRGTYSDSQLTKPLPPLPGSSLHYQKSEEYQAGVLKKLPKVSDAAPTEFLSRSPRLKLRKKMSVYSVTNDVRALPDNAVVDSSEHLSQDTFDARVPKLKLKISRSQIERAGVRQSQMRSKCSDPKHCELPAPPTTQVERHVWHNEDTNHPQTNAGLQPQNDRCGKNISREDIIIFEEPVEVKSQLKVHVDPRLVVETNFWLEVEPSQANTEEVAAKDINAST